MISVVIPSYKNRGMLFRNLKHNLRYLYDCEVIVVNDYPQESLKPYWSKFKNKAKLIENKSNLGFGQTVNIGVKKAKGSYIFLLNSDVVLRGRGFVRALKILKNDKTIFAVSFSQIEKNKEIVGGNAIHWHQGLVSTNKKLDHKNKYNAWAEGGSCLIDKKKFKRINGFDDIYRPFYWEDIDFSYRAWKAGYKILYEAKILVEHHHESTIGKYFSRFYIKKIAFRNQFIFIWKNITDKKLFREHLIYLPLNLARLTLKGEFSALVGFFTALLKLPEILRRRKKEKKKKAILDREIFAIFYE